MSARMFFSRYPDLYQFLLDEVISVAEIIQKTQNAVTPEEGTIYPVLIILAKLHPSASIDKNGDKFQVSFCLNL